MRTANYTDLRANLKGYIDSVIDDCDTVVSNRGNGTGVVMLSLEEYNSLLKTMSFIVISQNSGTIIVSFNFISWILGVVIFVVAENIDKDNIKNKITFFIATLLYFSYSLINLINKFNKSLQIKASKSLSFPDHLISFCNSSILIK